MPVWELAMAVLAAGHVCTVMGEVEYDDLVARHRRPIVITGFSAEEQVRVCESLGLKVLVDADNPATPLPDGTACWGYSLSDEPGTAAFPALAARVAALLTYTQLESSAAAVLALAVEEPLREFALRAATDRLPRLKNARLPLEPFTNTLRTGTPRQRAAK